MVTLSFQLLGPKHSKHLCFYSPLCPHTTLNQSGNTVGCIFKLSSHLTTFCYFHCFCQIRSTLISFSSLAVILLFLPLPIYSLLSMRQMERAFDNVNQNVLLLCMKPCDGFLFIWRNRQSPSHGLQVMCWPSVTCLT